jgi:hypothetical protein
MLLPAQHPSDSAQQVTSVSGERRCGNPAADLFHFSQRAGIWLARYKDRIPALPVLGTSKEAHPLRLIAAFPNPQNPKLGAVAYTATDAAAVPGINSVFAGSTAWVLARGTTVLSTGDYVQRDGRWLLK